MRSAPHGGGAGGPDLWWCLMKLNARQLSRRGWLAMISSVSVGTAIPKIPVSDAAAAGSADGTRVYNIRDYGAKGDGKTLDTVAIQSAIDACHKAHGGIVLVPAGSFVIGTVQLRSNVTLRIATEGTLLGSADGKQYHAAAEIPLRGDTTLGDGHVGLIFAVNAENITIEGPGTINGQGLQFRRPRRGVPPPSGRGGDRRPYHILLYRCRNIRLHNLYLLDSAYHSVRIIESDFVRASGLRIYNRVNGNNDGFHFISSRYVHVSECDVQSGDDACALFGSCSYVTIANSTFSTRWAVFRFGGGNPENITISNCVIYETFGCPIKMQFGPESKAQNILFNNLVMHDVTGPISIDVRGSRNHGLVSPAQGFVRNIMINGLQARVVAKGRQFSDMPFRESYRPGETRQCIVLNCIDDGVLENISISNAQIVYGGGGTQSEALRKVPQIAGEYFQIGTPPAYGLYARGVRGLSLSNVRFEVAKPDLRPALVLDNVNDAQINALSVNGDKSAISALRFIDTRDALLTAVRLLSPTAVFLRVEGSLCTNIIIDGGDLTKAVAPLALKSGAAASAVNLRL